jgi:predicted nucleotidyltransferase
VFGCVSGAHTYGFSSPDSDVDLRGCHVLPVRAVLGLRPPKGTIGRTWHVDGVEVDLVSHDVVKFVTLLLHPHGNYLEQLFSPLVVLTTPWAEELRELVRHGAISRRVYQPYAGFARGQWLEWRKQAIQGPAPIKPLLYAYRVSLTGIHLLRTGEVNANLAELAPEYGYGHLLALIAAKTTEGARWRCWSRNTPPPWRACRQRWSQPMRAARCPLSRPIRQRWTISWCGSGWQEACHELDRERYHPEDRVGQPGLWHGRPEQRPGRARGVHPARPLSAGAEQLRAVRGS